MISINDWTLFVVVIVLTSFMSKERQSQRNLSKRGGRKNARWKEIEKEIRNTSDQKH